MSKLSVLYSAETYVEEPGDLWTTGLPRRFRDEAFRLDSSKGVHAHAMRFEGTTARNLIAMLDQEGIDGAVLYPSRAARSFFVCPESDMQDAFLHVYNEWILAIASAAPHRLKAMALLNVENPAVAVQTMHRLLEQGAAGFVLPLTPSEAHRYDQPRYEVLWRAAAELGCPLSLLANTHRATEDETIGKNTMPHSTVATQLAFRATSVFPARRSITAIIYAGVFERYPTLRIGLVGFGAGWAAYAMVRADEMYEVRPERTGPPTRMPREINTDRAFLHLEHEAGVGIASDDRSGTRGMAPEGVGYHFPPGERFSDHFRRNVFLTFSKDSLGIALRSFIGVDGMLWGYCSGEGSNEDQRRSGIPRRRYRRDAHNWVPWRQRRDHLVRDYLDKLLEGVSDEEQYRLVCGNTARIYGFDPILRHATVNPSPLDAL